MTIQHIGFLHPGAMGVSLAATALNSGHKTYWASAQLSMNTRFRAAKHGLVEVLNIVALCDRSSVIISVCPPHAATDVAESICNCSFKGIYVDVNAISPQRVAQIEQAMLAAGVDFVDGGIIGPPAWTPDRTWLYLSGPSADKVSRCFSNGPLEVEVMSGEAGRASALKMCFAANSKGSTALLCAIMATADELGVREELETQWSRHGSDFALSTANRIRKATQKAWRFSGEMEEISSTFQSVGLPQGFHLAASDIYQRLAAFKDAEQTPPLDDIIAALLAADQQER